jgi:protein involved in polysaccharide export with SLBB domain
MAEQAETASRQGGQAARSKNTAIAFATRQRLRDGDFQVGDRVVVTVISDSVRIDTLAVRAGRYLELPNNIRVPLVGTLRSELKPRVTTEILKYIKAQQIDVTPLMRLGVLGEVAHPGYFALPSDIPLTDAIMAAGGPTTTADIESVIVRRASREYRTSDETRQAIARGMTLDQFGLNPGDELVIPRHRDISSGPWLALLGAAATVLTIVTALRH